MFLRFANFYQQFIQGFSQIAFPLTSILRILKLLARHQTIANKSTIISKIVSNNKVSEAKTEAKCFSRKKLKSKND